MSDQRPVADEVGSKLLFENEKIRVWDLRLEPGQSTGLHRHMDDYCYVVIGDGVLQGIGVDGDAGEPNPMRDGDVRFRHVEGEDVHEAVNRGTTPWRNIIVELKQTN
jgi:beta-alanine degradation protein BauB